jgi:hypothetical protein
VSPSTTTTPTSAPEGSDNPPAPPDLIIRAGDDEASMPSTGGYCWEHTDESGTTGQCVTVDTDPADYPRIDAEAGVPLQAYLPGTDWSITEAQLPWADDGTGACGSTTWTPTSTDDPATPVLLTAAIPPGTHTLLITAQVQEVVVTYHVVVEAGDGPTCPGGLGMEAEPFSPAYVYEFYGLAREEAVTKAGDGNWRDISAMGWPELVDREPEILGQVDLRFEDGIVLFALIHKSGLPSVVEGAENPDDVPYLGLELEDAYALAQREGREYCPVNGPCRADLDPERLRFHVDELRQGTTVIGVTRR